VLINQGAPRDWLDLQKQVHQILDECGFESEIEKVIQTVRGRVSIDVYARDPESQPPTIFLCECKHWQSRVPQTVVHALRTVVTDHGANWGFIVSSAGFQSGAYVAAANSNVKLLTWSELQGLFSERWVEKYMLPRLERETLPLVEYTEEVNSRIFRKADRLSEASQKRFVELRRRWQDLGFLSQHLFVGLQLFEDRLPQLPLRVPDQPGESIRRQNLPDRVLDATCLRDFTNDICDAAREGIAEFDQVFGERA